MSIPLPAAASSEADVPRLLQDINSTLDQMASAVRDQEFNRAGIVMHGFIEAAVSQWPNAKALPDFEPTIRRLLKEVFGIDPHSLAPTTPVGIAVARFYFVAWVDCATQAEAEQVMSERLGPEEDYGFPYTVDYRFRGTTNP